MCVSGLCICAFLWPPYWFLTCLQISFIFASAENLWCVIIMKNFVKREWNLVLSFPFYSSFYLLYIRFLENSKTTIFFDFVFCWLVAFDYNLYYFMVVLIQCLDDYLKNKRKNFFLCDQKNFIFGGSFCRKILKKKPYEKCMRIKRFIVQCFFFFFHFN